MVVRGDNMWAREKEMVVGQAELDKGGEGGKAGEGDIVGACHVTLSLRRSKSNYLNNWTLNLRLNQQHLPKQFLKNMSSLPYCSKLYLRTIMISCSNWKSY